MRLDSSHATVHALQRLVPETIAAGGSFADWLPDPSALAPAARVSAIASAQDAAAEECIRCLLRRAGFSENFQVQRGIDGDRDWPTGFVGSLTHKGTVVLGVIADRSLVDRVGVDLERLDRSDLLPIKHLIAPEGLPPGTDAQFGTLLAFSAKEAVFKAQYPTSRERLDFSDVRLAWAECERQRFRAVVDCPVPGLGVRAVLVGKWLVTSAISK
jgi:4'-phosphopantetheinyl transferase EntD